MAKYFGIGAKGKKPIFQTISMDRSLAQAKATMPELSVFPEDQFWNLLDLMNEYANKNPRPSPSRMDVSVLDQED